VRVLRDRAQPKESKPQHSENTAAMEPHLFRRLLAVKLHHDGPLEVLALDVAPEAHAVDRANLGLKKLGDLGLGVGVGGWGGDVGVDDDQTGGWAPIGCAGEGMPCTPTRPHPTPLQHPHPPPHTHRHRHRHTQTHTTTTTPHTQTHTPNPPTWSRVASIGNGRA